VTLERHQVYLVPGFFGFANLGELTYFSHLADFLREALRAHGIEPDIHTVRTHPTASLSRRAARVLETIMEANGPAALSGDGEPIHLIGHSSGGLDVRLLAAPGVTLPVPFEVEPWARRIRTVVSVATPHHGTPTAAFFTSLLGQRLLQVLSLATMEVLRFGRVPISALLRIGGILARVDNLVGLNSVVLDQIFGQLLEDFSPERRRAIQQFFASVGTDQSLMLQLAPEGMDLFNASTQRRPGTRYGSVVTRSRPPGLGSTLAAGLDPTAHATHTLYAAIYQLAASTPASRVPVLATEQLEALRRAYGQPVSVRDNDGVVPTMSQAMGEVIYAARADHLDIIGHFNDPRHVPPHYDWIATGSGFNRVQFETAWQAVATFVATSADRRQTPDRRAAQGGRRGSEAGDAGPGSDEPGGG
jgi:triacylglycerol esterase/lipase EstA (alpha/beta hydrolase family)